MHRVSMLENWPADVAVHILGAHGEPTTVERLGGMSLARVFRIDFEDEAIVAKASPHGMEMRFYEETADSLREAGVPIPDVEWTGYRDGEHWIVMEHLPGTLPLAETSEWSPDPQVMAALVTLHAATRDTGTTADGATPMTWGDRTTALALGFFDDEEAERIAPLLDAMKRRAARLEEPWCWISGDASAADWGVREGGTAVLFDWELFRPGTPASDLAPVVPGLIDAGDCATVANAYMLAATEADLALPWEADELAADTAAAKALTVVTLLQATGSGGTRVPESYIEHIVNAFPGWLEAATERYDIR